MQLIFNLILDVILAVFWLWILRQRKAHETEEKLLREQERFLDELAGQYAKHGDMLEALEESAQRCGSRVRRELMGFTDALRAESRPEDSGCFDSSAKNACLLLLFTLCYTIRTFGDLQIQGVSLFVHNIRYIKEEVRMELLRRQEGRYAFLGLTALCVIPFFFSIPIQLWSVSVSEGMQRFYTGSYGFMTLTICFTLAVFCSICVQELQYPTMPGRKKHTIAMRLLQIPMLSTIVDLHIAAHYSRYLKKNEVLKELQGFGNIREFLVQKAVCALTSAVFVRLILEGCHIASAADHVFGVAGQGANGMEILLIVILFGGIGYFLPDAWVVILQARAGQQKSEETLRFETLLLIVRHYRMITVEEIMRWMERFSGVFSRALQRAIDDFSYRRRDSLEQLKEELAYEPAVRLVDALIMCDEISVTQAFYDLEGERAYHMEQHRRKAESLQREKAAFARVIAFLPFVALLVLRMVVPFVLEGLIQLNAYQ